jgi:uncharacterized protein (TIGR03000 family)
MRKAITVVALGIAVATLTLALPETSYAGHGHGHGHHHSHVRWGRAWGGYHRYYYTPTYRYYTRPYYYYGNYYTAPVSSYVAPTVPNAAQIHICVPADARVWIGGDETTQGGADRVFESPPLAPGRDYCYTIKAEWAAPGGQVVSQTRQVDVSANAVVNVDFRNVL